MPVESRARVGRTVGGWKQSLRFLEREGGAADLDRHAGADQRHDRRGDTGRQDFASPVVDEAKHGVVAVERDCGDHGVASRVGVDEHLLGADEHQGCLAVGVKRQVVGQRYVAERAQRDGHVP